MTSPDPPSAGPDALPSADAATAPGRGPSSSDAAELLAIVDRLEALLDGSELSELEVEAGGTSFVLRRAHAVHAEPSSAAADAPRHAEAAPATPEPPAADEPARHAILAPLTGLFYTSPSPGAAPYVRVGGEVNVGQVIGLIEAMKLFNEIKSDIAGSVTRIVVESGALVKAKQPLIEVRPS